MPFFTLSGSLSWAPRVFLHLEGRRGFILLFFSRIRDDAPRALTHSRAKPIRVEDIGIESDSLTSQLILLLNFTQERRNFRE